MNRFACDSRCRPAAALSLALIICALVAGVSGSAIAAGGQESPAAAHVYVISIDGLRPDFYRDATWPAPTLQWMAREGVSADGVRGVFPTVTYPSHTTMITGALPARHGIYYNSPFEPEGQTGRWYWEEELIRVPTLWDAVRAAGGTSASFWWPVSVGAPIDYNVPEVWSLEDGYGTDEPLRWNDTPDGFVEELEREATGTFTDGKLSSDYLTREMLTASAAAYTIETYRPNLMTVHLIGVDHFQHEDGRDSVKVRRALSAADSAVFELVEAATRAGIIERTAFIVTGDHGFVDIHSSLAPNVWLAEAGLLEPQPDRGEWRAAFHSGVASAFLHLRDPDDTETIERVRAIVESRPRSERRLYRVLDAEELAAIGADPTVPLALAFVPGVSFSSAASGDALRPSGGGTHGFYPDLDEIETGFIGWGAGFAERVVVAEMGLEDIAPAVAHLLGLRFEAPDGTAYPGLFAR
jgi:predicted AlkP superfamily pyrophosphatase or phosphodiesterase